MNLQRPAKGRRFSLPREFVTDHLDAHLFAHLEPKVTDEVLIDPGFQFAHPERKKKCVSLRLFFHGDVGLVDIRQNTIDTISMVCRLFCGYIPESGFGLTALCGTSTSGRFSGGGSLERRGSGIGLASHGGIRRGRSTGRSSRGISSSVLVLEGIEVLERHIRVEK